VDETRAYQSRGAPHQCWTSILGCNQNMSNLFKILNACSVLWLTMNTNPKLDNNKLPRKISTNNTVWGRDGSKTVVRKKTGLIFVRLSLFRPCCIKNRNYQSVCLPARKERFYRRDTPGSPQARPSSGKPHPRRIALLARLFSAPAVLVDQEWLKELVKAG
jgi:hypothetical protein